MVLYAQEAKSRFPQFKKQFALFIYLPKISWTEYPEHNQFPGRIYYDFKKLYPNSPRNPAGKKDQNYQSNIKIYTLKFSLKPFFMFFYSVIQFFLIAFYADDVMIFAFYYGFYSIFLTMQSV